jgi:signal transduction histidine kinase
MRQRLVLSTVVLVALVLLLVETPLGIVYSRHEHDALNSALSRDAASLGALAEEVLENPGSHDVAGLATRFAANAGGAVAIVDHSGKLVTPPAPARTQAQFDIALQKARGGTTNSGEVNGLVYVSVPLGPRTDQEGAILVARADDTVDRRVHTFWMLLVALGAAVLLVAFGVGYRLAKWAIDPLQQLDERAAELGGGNLAVRADTSHGPPEVKALAATFNEMAAQLDQLVTSQRRFVADASHQLRTPLTALRLRLDNLDPSDPDSVSTTRDAALVETARLTRLVDGLLQLARSEAPDSERKVVDVVDVTMQRADAWTLLAQESAIDLTHHAPSRAVHATLVSGQLEQVLDNLLANALDASSPGGAVSVAIDAGDTDVEIHVVDNGRGMTDEERARAFDPFWQSPSGRSNGSAGLGLAIVEQLVRGNGGHVTLSRSDAGGIDATVHLPRTHVM